MDGKLVEHLEYFLSGSTVLGIIAHAVSTFPTPKNPYGQWFIGVIQWIVGQRMQGQVTVKGQTIVGIETVGAKDVPPKE